MKNRVPFSLIRSRSLTIIFLGTITLIVILGNLSNTAANGQSRHLKAGPVMKSEQISEAEQRLNALGYWTGKVDGVFDPATRHALIAFQKTMGRKRTGQLTPEELEAMKTAARPRPLETGEAHIEVDLSRQVLFVVDGKGEVSKILPVSSGNGKLYNEGGMSGRAVTPKGRFKTYNKLNGWRKSPLGLLYYPNYIHKGYAIHGNPSVPVYPASHGCIRIPMFAAIEFSKMTPIGTFVIIHDGSIPAKP
jgi:hypothetical protein